MKEEFIELLKSTNREGMENLLNFLEKSDFYKAPASTRFHGNYEGGLLALLHDICKTNFYKVDYRNAKNARGEWEKVPYYAVEDTIPYGHGEKSVMMLTEYIKLTNEEKYSIRWHMGFTEPKELYGTLGEAYKKYPAALLLHEADLESTYFYNI